jgi:hypothetical protein
VHLIRDIVNQEWSNPCEFFHVHGLRGVEIRFGVGSASESRECQQLGTYPTPHFSSCRRTAYTQFKPMQRSIARSNKLQGSLKQDPGSPEYRKSLSRPGGSRVYSSHSLMPAFLPPDPNCHSSRDPIILNNPQICFFLICAA